MPELTPELVANLKMIGGALLIGLFLFWDNIKAVIPNIKFPNITPEPVVTPKVENLLQEHSIHEVICELIKARKEAKDEAGVMLISSFGKHIYDFYTEEINGKD